MIFSLGICEELSLCPPLPANVNKLKQTINTAVETVTKDMLQRASEELDYRLGVCRVTGGAHIEHLRNLSWNSRAFKLLIKIYRNKSYFDQHYACLVSFDLTLKILLVVQNFNIAFFNFRTCEIFLSRALQYKRNHWPVLIT